MSFLYRLKLFVYFSNFSLLFFKVVDFFRIFFHSELPLDQIQTTRRFRNREEWDGARLEKSWEHWSIVSSCLNIPISKEKYTKEASGQSHGKSKKFNKLRCLVWLNYKKYIYIYISAALYWIYFCTSLAWKSQGLLEKLNQIKVIMLYRNLKNPKYEISSFICLLSIDLNDHFWILFFLLQYFCLRWKMLKTKLQRFQ